MYVIAVYDITKNKSSKMLKLLRRYLNWIQGSVFEGEISEGNYIEMTQNIRNNINRNSDSVILFKMWGEQYRIREVIGIEKNKVSNVL